MSGLSLGAATRPTKEELSFAKERAGSFTPWPTRNISCYRTDTLEQNRPFQHVEGAYKYSPLNPEANEIRLLTLFPKDVDDVVNCVLRTVSLDNFPSYDALSYTWGDWTDHEYIYLGNYKHKVMRNLALAHRRLHQGNVEPQKIWIDALFP
jgi:hypothetical protein